MVELEPLADFPASISKAQTLADNGIRITLDLPETEAAILSKAHELKIGERYLYVVIYDADEFQKACINTQKT